MGNGKNELVSVTILENIWKKMKWFFCSTNIHESEEDFVVVKNNGSRPLIDFKSTCEVAIFDSMGKKVNAQIEQLPIGVYFLHCSEGNYKKIIKILVGEN
jgi:hypothetical protein